ncbi:FUSC family protein [Mangrovicella endophytica]|uniref:FUSC family protein n=1 Tax=Mangrovicella endophytica TaxID=2066697 RepID=UPI0013000AF3|nr:FUSC family protein [Mangrovicella endophytica]
MALRVTVTLVAVVTGLAGIHLVYALPPAAYGVAMITAMQGALQVREASMRGQTVTRTLSGFAGWYAVALASAVSAHPWAGHVLLLLLIFAAVYIRRFGPRWNAVGMFAFMSYFIGSYLHPAPADLLGIAIAIALSGVIAHVTRNTLLAEDGQRDLARTLLAVDRRIAELLTLTRLGMEAGWVGTLRRRAVQAENGVKDAILVAEGLVPAPGESSVYASDDPDRPADLPDASTALLDLHLATESVLLASFDPGTPEKDNRALQQSYRQAEQRLQRARQVVTQVVDRLPPEAFTSSGAPPPARFAASLAGSSTFGDPALRLAIQVTLAAAVAMAGGLYLSPTRWFWAILTAFLVFTNTQSRGDTALRAINRALGTLLGVIAGIGVATLIGNELAVALPLVAVFVFTGFYLLQLSYGAMTFFITLAISLVYGLIGQFTPDLLLLRLEETLVGAAAGVFIAFLIFPQSTTRLADEAASRFFAAVDELLAAAEDSLDGHVRRGELLRLSRQIDRRYGDLAAAARPLGSNWQVVRKPGPVRQTLTRFLACAHWSRIFARRMSEHRGDEASTAALRAAIAELRRQVDDAGKATGLFVEGPARRGKERLPEARRADFHERTDDPLFCLELLSHIVARTVRSGRQASQPAPPAS